ncbi:lipoxygenase homology domain-containing protein 1-like [Phacochoerus africanus]|uniref:lipoxygenase homology domain-containing protein 1-like n=1 Tax=Phacochoerus africanus TaxID=41426 RepID=UPI001FDA55DC|nr:lipoxygenase homology domain-containing protein 1-like [Phacochoerus africanus]
MNLQFEKSNWRCGGVIYLFSFVLQINLKDGKIYKIRVGRDNSGKDPRWNLEEMRLEKINTQELLCFAVDPWMAENENDGERTERLGQVDVFSIEAVALGELEKIWISHDGTGPVFTGNGWFLERVVLKCEEEDGNQEALFPCNRCAVTGPSLRAVMRPLSRTSSWTPACPSICLATLHPPLKPEWKACTP